MKITFLNSLTKTVKFSEWKHQLGRMLRYSPSLTRHYYWWRRNFQHTIARYRAALVDGVWEFHRTDLLYKIKTAVYFEHELSILFTYTVLLGQDDDDGEGKTTDYKRKKKFTSSLLTCAEEDVFPVLRWCSFFRYLIAVGDVCAICTEIVEVDYAVYLVQWCLFFMLRKIFAVSFFCIIYFIRQCFFVFIN